MSTRLGADRLGQGARHPRARWTAGHSPGVAITVPKATGSLFFKEASGFTTQTRLQRGDCHSPHNQSEPPTTATLRTCSSWPRMHNRDGRACPPSILSHRQQRCSLRHVLTPGHVCVLPPRSRVHANPRSRVHANPRSHVCTNPRSHACTNPGSRVCTNPGSCVCALTPGPVCALTPGHLHVDPGSPVDRVKQSAAFPGVATEPKQA